MGLIELLLLWAGFPYQLCEPPWSCSSVGWAVSVRSSLAQGTSWIAVWFKLDGTKALITVSGTWSFHEYFFLPHSILWLFPAFLFLDSHWLFFLCNSCHCLTQLCPVTSLLHVYVSVNIDIYKISSQICRGGESGRSFLTFIRSGGPGIRQAPTGKRWSKGIGETAKPVMFIHC